MSLRSMSGRRRTASRLLREEMPEDPKETTDFKVPEMSETAAASTPAAMCELDRAGFEARATDQHDSAALNHPVHGSGADYYHARFKQRHRARHQELAQLEGCAPKAAAGVDQRGCYVPAGAAADSEVEDEAEAEAGAEAEAEMEMEEEEAAAAEAGAKAEAEAKAEVETEEEAEEVEAGASSRDAPPAVADETYVERSQDASDVCDGVRTAG